MLDVHRFARERHKLHVAEIVVEWMVPDLDVAYCVDRRGRKYTIDRRSAVSFSALSDGMRLKVRATPGGVVKTLVFDDE